MINEQLRVVDEISELFKGRSSKIPIEAIGLPARALNIVRARDAKNSYQAVSIVLSDFSGISGIGAKTISESRAAIYGFINSVETASEDELKKLIDSREEFLSSANGNLVDAFPAVIELYFRKKSENNCDRNKDIINKRFGLNGNKTYVLEDLGTYYDLTRERIRQIEAKAIREIGLLLEGRLNQKGWKICPSLEKNYKEIKEKLLSLDWVILKPNLETILLESFGGTLKAGYLDLFMEMCGYTKIPNGFSGFRGVIRESWCPGSRYKKKEVESIYQALDIIFDSVSPVSIFDLTVSAKKKAKSKISNDSIRIALSATEDIENNGEEVLVKFTRLRGAADKAFRVLELHKKPLHFSKIAQEINLLSKGASGFKVVKEMNLKNQLVADERFTPIGRSGEWGLTIWDNLNNITIIQAIEKILHDSGEPLKFDQIEKGVATLRPDASDKSLKVYLNDPSLFTRVGRNEFALLSWRMSPVPRKRKKRTVSVGEFNVAMTNVLTDKNPVDFPELISLMMESTHLSEISVRQRILSTEGLKIDTQQGKRCKTVFCLDIDALNQPPKEGGKKLLRDRVQDEVRSILFDQPNVPIKKGVLYKEVVKNVTCMKPTFYHYLKVMDDISQYKDGNDYYAVYKHEEVVGKIEVDIGQYTTDSKTIDALKRPLSKLTVDDIDMALFELGLQFENALKQYLMKQKELKKITVSSKDISKLAYMIDCVVREGVVKKGHHLNTLREERNNRAHGGMPNDQERKILFNKAHYITDLFVRYICFFHEETKREIQDQRISLPN